MFQMNLFKQIKKMDKLICFFKLSFVGIKVNGICANVQNECIQNAVCDKNHKCQCKWDTLTKINLVSIQRQL
jgi:hypothetical protein